ncbi:MAG TPA: hypothetical protein VFF33_08740 [Ignavibacteriaceae bacterium]|nr:hypothetical protein [Ignavibacteriaceae bacterium]
MNSFSTVSALTNIVSEFDKLTSLASFFQFFDSAPNCLYNTSSKCRKNNCTEDKCIRKYNNNVNKIITDLSKKYFSSILWSSPTYYSIIENRFILNNVDKEVDQNSLKSYLKSKDLIRISELAQKELKLSDNISIVVSLISTLNRTNVVKPYKILTNDNNNRLSKPNTLTITFKNDILKFVFEIININDKHIKIIKRYKHFYGKDKLNQIITNHCGKLTYGLLFLFKVDYSLKQMIYHVIHFGQGVSNFGINLGLSKYEYSCTRQIEREEFIKELHAIVKYHYYFLALKEQKLRLEEKNLKTAVISILVDSYAHNISAHSLAALKWWFELRSKILCKRIYIGNDPIKFENLQPQNINIKREVKNYSTSITSDSSQFQTDDPVFSTGYKYYDALGLTDSSFNSRYFSLFDLLQYNFLDDSFSNILSFNNEQKYSHKVNDTFKPRFPVSLDYALFPFLRFLRDKGAFWSGVTRDISFGGESKSWYDILWTDFSNNPLYLGSIAKSEGITKLKLNLAIRHPLTKNKWISGRFVTIDLSLLEYEERIANNPRLKIEYDEKDYELIESYLPALNILPEDVKKNRVSINDSILFKLDEKLKEILLSVDADNDEYCFFNNSNKCKRYSSKFVDSSKYNKYALIRLGKCFSHFREILQTSTFKAFLPGGVIGEHALFTIFENSIRNIKHYKSESDLAKIRKHGIDFWISIENLKTNPNKFFKICVWLGHPNKLQIHRKDENTFLWEKVYQSSVMPILDEKDGIPRMGGNAQDKACAAMLFNTKFSSVESRSGDVLLNYPWKHYVTNQSEYHFVSDYDLPDIHGCSEDERSIKIDKYRKAINSDSTGVLKSFFLVWRGEDYLLLKDTKDLCGENISRFKFLIIQNVKEQDHLLEMSRREGVIRIISDKKGQAILKTKVKKPYKGNQILEQLYFLWLKSWLRIEDNLKIVFVHNWDRKVIEINIKKKTIQDVGSELNSSTHNVILTISHGGLDEDNCCNIRSHGMFWNKFFSNFESNPCKLVSNSQNIVELTENKNLILEFAEIVASRIYIFDNRLHSRLPLSKQKISVYETALNFLIREEKLIENSFKYDINNLICQYGSPHILIIHLSFIESLGYPETTKGFINEFIKNELEHLISNPNFILVITTGRGRSSWINELNSNYSKHTIFKPIESFINAIESGISYNDDFDIKYNLIKVVFGS